MSEEITCGDIDWLDEQHDVESMIETLESIKKWLQSYLNMIDRLCGSCMRVRPKYDLGGETR